MSNYAVGLTHDQLTHETVLTNSKKYNQNFQLLLISILSKSKFSLNLQSNKILSKEFGPISSTYLLTQIV